jgi:tRNA(fMet)-specific endonuclease VapC
VVVRLALDTSAYSALMRGHRDVAALIRRSTVVLLPAVVAGELLYGFRSGSRFEENAARLETFLEARCVELLPVTFATADRFGRIMTGLRRKGTPLPTNDVWIAAQSMEVGADLLSSDAHFGEIDGLAWIPFSPDDQDSVRERVRRYHAGPED